MRTGTKITVVVVIAILAVAAYMFYDLNGKSFDLSDRQMLLIVTDSMDGNVTEYEIDSFPKNTFITVEKLTAEEIMSLEVGDVISFWYGSILDHHRIYELDFDHGYVKTRGDRPDLIVGSGETVKLTDINGKVIGTNHMIGATVDWVKNNFLILVAAIAIFAIAGEIYRAYKNGVFEKEG